MSLADSVHILTVLGSRAGFSAETTDVCKYELHINFDIKLDDTVSQ